MGGELCVIVVETLAILGGENRNKVDSVCRCVGVPRQPKLGYVPLLGRNLVSLAFDVVSMSNNLIDFWVSDNLTFFWYTLHFLYIHVCLHPRASQGELLVRGG